MSQGTNYLRSAIEKGVAYTMAFLTGNTEEIENLEQQNQSEDRAVSMDDVWWQSQMQSWDKDDWARVINIYTDDGNSMYAVIASEGKLYRAGVTVSDDVVTLSEEWVPVVHKQQFEPIEEDDEDRTRSMTQIRQMEDGHYRWLSVSCTAVLNRSGSIDSRKLFDSFIDKIERGEEEYPKRYFYHITEDKFQTGVCDFVARDGYLLITSGLYDDFEENPLAKAEVEARLDDPDYWGESIGFLATEPDMVEIVDGIELPVFNDGILREISNLPEADAASWYTNFTNVQEVKRVMNKKAKEALVKLVGEDDAEQYLEETDSINQEIENSNVIKRSQEEQREDEEVETETVEAEVQTEDEPVVEDEEPTEELPTEEAVEDEPVSEEEEPKEVIAEEFELDGELFDEITESVVEKMRSENEDLKERVATLEGLFETLSGELKSNQNRLNDLEKGDDEKRQEWLDDLPRKPKKVIYRRRNQVGEIEMKKDEVSSEEIAQDSLSKIP